MTAAIIQAKYADLDAIAARFGQCVDDTNELQRRLQQRVQALTDGGWEGRGVAAFSSEMDSEVFPALQRLIQALDLARSVTLQIKELMQQAEEEAAAPFQAMQQEATLLDTIMGGISDFVAGMGDELGDMIHGLVNMVTDPIGTAQGLWHAVQHPDQLWEAFKQPYVEAWESGHPLRAIGRGVMFVGSMLIGTKGADKLAKAAKISRAAEVAAEAAQASSRFGNALNAAKALDKVAEGSRAEAGIARYIAQESTHQAGSVDRVVLGRYEGNPARNFAGYINEAKANGGIYFNTGGDVWDTIKSNGRGWVPNREFLQAQMERGVQRIELHGESVSEVRKFRPDSATAREMEFLRSNAAEYGYRQNGNVWEKVGDWRASTGGRITGGSVGPGLGALEDAQSTEQTSRR